MGCCGHDFISEKKISEAIELNTKEYNGLLEKSEENLGRFRERAHRNELRYGVCRNLVSMDGCVGCPLHPSLHEGKDLREGHCDAGYLCKTAKAFEGWDGEKQNSFILFVEGKKLGNIAYSLQMDRDELLGEFERLE